MAGIDKFIEVVAKYGADGLVFDPDQRAVIVSGESRRYVTAQAVSESQIQELVREILPTDTTQVRSTQGGREFDYASPGGTARVRLRRHATGTRVEIALVNETVEPELRVDAAATSGAAPPEPTTAPAGAVASRPRDENVVSNIATSPSEAAAVVTPAATSLAAGRGLLAKAPQARPKIEVLFEKMVQQRCSDLHLCVGSPPLFRKDGEMTSLGEKTPLGADEIRGFLIEITPHPNCTEFDSTNDTDFSYEMNENARFRVNLFQDRRGLGAVFRFIPGKIPTPQELGLSKSVLELCMLPKGLVLVTGPTGSGKSTTLAALIDHINSTRSAHIITIEDPIEFVYTNRRSLINQREVGVHTESFKSALRAALREDPDIVLVGEMRDLETVTIALETAETGHLVFGTLHTNTAPSAIDRIIDQFPADRQAQVRTMLSDTLRGVIAQSLLKRRGGGLIAAQEILLVNSAVSNLIREGKTFQVPSIIQTGRAQGMVTMDEALLGLVRSGLVDSETALSKAPNRTEFKQALERLRDQKPSLETRRTPTAV